MRKISTYIITASAFVLAASKLIALISGNESVEIVADIALIFLGAGAIIWGITMLNEKNNK